MKTDEKIIAAQKMVVDLCHGDRQWIMSIPARPDRDPDLVIGDALRAAQQELKRLREARLGVDSDSQVFFYERDFYIFSNFSAFRVQWKRWVFDTSEAAYHWEKFPHNRAIQSAILYSRSAHQALKIAENYRNEIRPDWLDVRVGIMREILFAKVDQHEYVRRKLLATGDRELIEDSWRDSFWGWGSKRDGQNTLGKLWMEVRAELRRRAV